MCLQNGHTAFDEAKKWKQLVTVSVFEKVFFCKLQRVATMVILCFSPQTETEILWNACRSGDLVTVKEHLHKAELNQKNPQYVRLLKQRHNYNIQRKSYYWNPPGMHHAPYCCHVSQ